MLSQASLMKNINCALNVIWKWPQNIMFRRLKVWMEAMYAKTDRNSGEFYWEDKHGEF